MNSKSNPPESGAPDFAYEQSGDLAPDVPELHRALMAEQVEPHEGNERVPVLVYLCFLGLAMWGGWYLSEFDGGFQANVYDGPEAFRSVDYLAGGAPKPIDPVKLGKRVFNTCVTCHQTNGEGIAGKYPPLNQSEWVMGDDRILARIVINGLAGPIEVRGNAYNAIMPAWRQLTDHDIAAVLTHVRSQWDNDARPVAPATVAEVRSLIGDRTEPFAPNDLKGIELPPQVEYSEEEILAQYRDAKPSAIEETDETKWIKNLDPAVVIEQLVAGSGDAAKGKLLFTTATCVTCHVGSETVKPIGPKLEEVAKRLKREQIVDSILHPSAVITKGYESVKLMIWDGTMQTGSVVEENEDVLKLQIASGETIEIPIDDIDDRALSDTSPMPVGLVDMLTVDQVSDLIAYLESL